MQYWHCHVSFFSSNDAVSVLHWTSEAMTWQPYAITCLFAHSSLYMYNNITYLKCKMKTAYGFCEMDKFSRMTLHYTIQSSCSPLQKLSDGFLCVSQILTKSLEQTVNTRVLCFPSSSWNERFLCHITISLLQQPAYSSKAHKTE